MEIERDKQRAKIESSRNELKALSAQYGTKAKVADEERDTSKLCGSIEDLLARIQSSKFNEKNAEASYQKGIEVEKDKHKTFKSYQKSAEMGDVYGVFNVGYCYFNGIGVKKDIFMALIYISSIRNNLMSFLKR
ncbi:HCP-like protein [Gigaspora margarita]|uniref:HCP-like protein n=1 Tax=Gigaspora margarita TaxID=4874 RepID=A0A8H4B1S7_GIGMA|nr:HCP-like protein [Gigaspora margarita]